MNIHPVIAEMRRTRKDLGLSLLELAELSGVSHTAIGTWERGINSPTIDRLELVLAALKLRLAALPGGESTWLLTVELGADGRPHTPRLIGGAA